MRKARRQSFQPSAALCLSAATLLASGALAQYADVGLSTVRAQRFGRSSFPHPNLGGHDHFGHALAAGDFNGDGADDLAIGAPLSSGLTAFITQCGAAFVRYGVVGKGLDAVAEPAVLGQFVGPVNSAEPHDWFGWALVACNLNGDEYDDLVVGVPYESITVGIGIDFLQAGMVEIYHGTSSGLVPPATMTRREVANLTFPSAGAHFGQTLACGDFDNDGYDDLVVGLPHRDLPSGATDGGRINVYMGSPSGIATSASAIDQDTSGIEGVGESNDQFGMVLVAGDFAGDNFDDLAVGIFEETDAGAIAAGAVQMLYSNGVGLGTDDHIFFDSAFGGSNGLHHHFGFALAVGNFNLDVDADLAIGAPFDDVAAVDSAGQVVEAFGSADGVSPAGSERFDQDRILGEGASAPFELFGLALAAGDFDGDGVDDLAAADPREAVLGIEDGAVTIVMGRAWFGLDPAPNRHRQINRGIEGFPGDVNEHEARFGDVLATGDFDGNGYADLAIGSPLEDEDGMPSVGTVTVLFGALFADGFEDAGTAYWSAFVP